MNPPIPLLPEDWLEKQFTFALPLGAFLAVLERVRGTPARLEELVGGLPPAILTTQGIGDTWSIPVSPIPSVVRMAGGGWPAGFLPAGPGCRAPPTAPRATSQALWRTWRPLVRPVQSEIQK